MILQTQIDAVDLIYKIASPAVVIGIFIITFDYFFRRALSRNKDAVKAIVDELYGNVWNNQKKEFHELMDEQKLLINETTNNLHKLEIIVARIDERRRDRP